MTAEPKAPAAKETAPNERADIRERVEERLRQRKQPPAAEPSATRTERRPPPGRPPAPGPAGPEHWTSTVRRQVAEGRPAEKPVGTSVAKPAETPGPAGATGKPAPAPQPAPKPTPKPAAQPPSDPTDDIRARVERRLQETDERRTEGAPPDSPATRTTPVEVEPGPRLAPDPEPGASPYDPSGAEEWDGGWAGAGERPPELEEEPEPPAPGPLAGIAAFVATCGFVGRVRFAPGTVGSVVGLAAFALTRNLPGTVSLGLFAACLLVGTWAAARHARDLRQSDPPSVVVDEFCGMWLALLGTNPSLLAAGVAFAAFRFLDIVKPPPVRQAERLPGGFGIMADDLVAGGIVRLGILFILAM